MIDKLGGAKKKGKSRMDMFYLGDCLRGLNLNPTLKMIDKLGGAKKKGEKFIKLEEFYPIYSDVKKSLPMAIDSSTRRCSMFMMLVKRFTAVFASLTSSLPRFSR